MKMSLAHLHEQVIVCETFHGYIIIAVVFYPEFLQFQSFEKIKCLAIMR